MKRWKGVGRLLVSYVAAIAVCGAVVGVLLRVANPGSGLVEEPKPTAKPAGERVDRMLIFKSDEKVVRTTTHGMEPPNAETSDTWAGGASVDSLDLAGEIEPSNGGEERLESSTGEEGGFGFAAAQSASTSGAIPALDPRAEAWEAYGVRTSEANDDVGAQAELALWCDSKGLWEPALIHWEAVFERDQTHAAAQRRLGIRLREGDWVVDQARAEEVAQQKANSFWEKALAVQHRRMHRSGTTAEAERVRNEALERVEAIADPRAAGAIWKVFAGHASHHGLIVQTLARFETKASTQMLAALAIYSQDEKARNAAVEALRGRDPVAFGEQLVALMNTPLQYEIRTVRQPGMAPVQLMFVQGEQADFAFLFARQEAPSALCGMNPGLRLTAQERALARQYNRNQTNLVQVSMKQQLALARQSIEDLNRSIQTRNEQVASILNTACNAGIAADPEAGRQWLARTLGTEYKPVSARAKPTITQVVQPLYRPSFLPVPVPS